MAWLPVASVLAVRVAVVTPSAVTSVPVPMGSSPSKKVTVPVGGGTAVPAGPAAVTVAMNVTARPKTGGSGGAATTVVVAVLPAVGGVVPEPAAGVANGTRFVGPFGALVSMIACRGGPVAAAP